MRGSAAAVLRAGVLGAVTSMISGQAAQGVMFDPREPAESAAVSPPAVQTHPALDPDPGDDPEGSSRQPLERYLLAHDCAVLFEAGEAIEAQRREAQAPQQVSLADLAAEIDRRNDDREAHDKPRAVPANALPALLDYLGQFGDGVTYDRSFALLVFSAPPMPDLRADLTPDMLAGL